MVKTATWDKEEADGTCDEIKLSQKNGRSVQGHRSEVMFKLLCGGNCPCYANAGRTCQGLV
jgi:hypothetical protein